MMPLKDIDAVLRERAEAEAKRTKTEIDHVKNVGKTVFGVTMGLGAGLFLISMIDLHSPLDLLASAAMVYYIYVGARSTA